MPIDSTANLLFNIGANSDDAEENITRFRTLLGKDLSDMTGEFADWSHEVFGDLTTIQGATTAAAAAVGAAVVGIGSLIAEETRKYSEYVEEIEHGSRVTGISAEQMSTLYTAAKVTGTSFEALTKGLTFFENAVVQANSGGQQQAKVFQELGISQEQLKAGEKDIIPLLEQVMNRFHGLSSGTEQAAMARQLFSRNGTEMLDFLRLGAAGLAAMEERARELGIVITEKDTKAFKEQKAASAELQLALESVTVAIGREVMPHLVMLTAIVASLPEAMKKSAEELKGWRAGIKGALTGGLSDMSTFLSEWGNAATAEVKRIQRLIDTMSVIDAGKGKSLDLGSGAAEATKEWSGFAEILTRVKTEIAETQGPEAQLTDKMDLLSAEIGKAGTAFNQLVADGKLSAAQAQEQKRVFLELTELFPKLAEALNKVNADKMATAVRNAGEELKELILRQGEQTIAVKDELLAAEVAKRRAAMEQEHTDTAENLAWLAAYEKAARQKITDDKIAEFEKFDGELAQRERASGQRSYEQKVADYNREIDALAAQGAKIGQGVQNFEARIAALRKAGLDKIAADEKAAYDQEAARLGEQRERIEERHQTSAQRIAAQYAADVAKYSAAEEKKTLATAVGEAQRAAIQQQFAAIRKGLTDREQADLQQLLNSTGWQGIFGAKFGELIRGNENLTREWASSMNQSAMMVKVTLEGLKETGEKTFEGLAQGMGGNIAHAIVYSKSIGAAMKAALESTLENLAAQAITYAIYSTALGFTDLAEGNEPGAAAAFTAAGIWAAVGAAAGLAGRGLAGGSSGGSASASGAGSAGLGTNAAQRNAAQADQGSVGPPMGANGPHVTVNVWGHVVGTSGVGELCGMINDAVMNSDTQLTATNTKTGVQVNQ